MRKVAERVRTRCAAFRSKSRGLHVYLFASEPVPARVMHEYLVAVRKRLPRAIAKQTETFPKAGQVHVAPDNEPTAVNLPIHGQQREFAFAVTHEGVRWALDDMPLPDLLDSINRHCRTDAETLTQIAKEQPVLDTSEIGYRVPHNPAGRNDLLMRIAMSMQARGWDNEGMKAELYRLNREGERFHDVFDGKGQLPDAEIEAMLKQAWKREKGTPTPLSYRQVEKFNREWAVMRVNGQVEFLNKDEGQCYAKSAFLDATAPQTVRVGKSVVPVAKLWLQDVDRHEYRGIVIEPPDYDGPGFNVFGGWACTPVEGDASLWVDYVENVLCSGDRDLAHWVMTYIADGVQRPWSLHPGSALALRGGQGGGKSFLGRAMRKLLGAAHAQQIAEADRMFARFNRGLFGSTFVLCEESLFAGSTKQAAIAKSFITSDTWSYEQKFLATFDGKNVHRIIATTNEDQAVHIDHDDRRWTVIEVPTRFDDHGPEARACWAPYYDLIDNHPGVVLRYLLDYPVDRGLIQYGHVTAAKASDKIASDPLLQVMDEMAQTGVAFDDWRGDGRVSAATLAREVWARGGSKRDSPRRYTNQAREKFGAKSVPNCIHIETVHRGMSADGVLNVTPIYRSDRAGIQLPPLAEFRRIMSRISGRDYPDGGEWAPFEVAGPGYDSDPNGGDADAVEEQWVKDKGE